MSSPPDGGAAIMHGLMKVKGPLWPIAVILHIPPPPEESEEIVPASHLVLSLTRLFIQALDLFHTLGHWSAAGPTRLLHRYYCLLPWVVSKAGNDGGGSSSHGVHLAGRKLRCIWLFEPHIKGARAGSLYVIGAHGTSVAWEGNPLLPGLPWCVFLTNLSASHIFWHIQYGKGCSRAKYKSIFCIKEERLKRFIMEERSLTCFWWERRNFFFHKELNRSVCVQN